MCFVVNSSLFLFNYLLYEILVQSLIGLLENVSGYSRNPCSLNRERDAALKRFGNAHCVTESETHIESRQFIG